MLNAFSVPNYHPLMHQLTAEPLKMIKIFKMFKNVLLKANRSIQFFSLEETLIETMKNKCDSAKCSPDGSLGRDEYVIFI